MRPSASCHEGRTSPTVSSVSNGDVSQGDATGDSIQISEGWTERDKQLPSHDGQITQPEVDATPLKVTD